MRAIIKQEFDTIVFNTPYYRIKELSIDKVENELAILKKRGTIIIDAKIKSNDIMWDIYLQKNAFRKICLQVELFKTVESNRHFDSVDIIKMHSMSKTIINRHVRNIVYDRFSLDSRIKKKTRNMLFYKWIDNSLSSGDVYFAVKDDNFCSFKIHKNEAIIDLMSVLAQRKNIGSQLLAAVEGYLSVLRIPRIKVITECENIHAFKFYLKNKYAITNFLSCFHYIK